MLAKKKFEELKQLQNNQLLDKKILEAIKLDLLHKEGIDKDEIPKKLKKIFERVNEKGLFQKLLKQEVEGIASYYFIEDRNDSKTKKILREYFKVSLVEDFDEYYEEIVKISKRNSNSDTSATYGFILITASIILIIGVLGGLAVMSESIELGLGAIISTSAFAAILFGIANIIKLLSDKK
jgi:hypothetical protein